MQTSSLPAYTFGHFTVDFSCGLILYRMIEQGYADGAFAVSLILVYNIIAFGAQFFLGIIGDFIKDNGRIPAVAGCILCVGGLLTGEEAPLLTACLMGAGNALFHVGGGTDALIRSSGMSRAGIFVSAGALGVAAGCHYGTSGEMHIQIAASLLLFAAACIWVFCPGKRVCVCDTPAPSSKKGILPAEPITGNGIFSVFVILIAVYIRSWAGFAATVPDIDGKFARFIPAFAAFAGKFAGGILADIFGSRRTGTAAVLISAPLFLLGAEKTLFFLAALFFFNMAMPVTLCELAGRMRGHEGFAFGLTALALLLGYLTYYLLPAAEESVNSSAAFGVPVACIAAAIAIFITASDRGALISEWITPSDGTDEK